MNENEESQEEHLDGALFADLREAALFYIKGMETIWADCSEDRQAEILRRFDEKVKEVVRDGVRIITAHQWPAIPAVVEQVTFKDGIKAVMKISAAEPSRHRLADRTGGQAMIVIVDPEVFMTEDGTTVPEPDQQSLLEEVEEGTEGELHEEHEHPDDEVQRDIDRDKESR